MAYLIQVEQIEREVLTIRGQAAFMDAKAQLPTVEQAVDEFEAWLNSPPDMRPLTTEQIEREELTALMLNRG